MKKYELLVDDTITIFGVQLFRIKALISFSGIEKENNKCLCCRKNYLKNLITKFLLMQK